MFSFTSYFSQAFQLMDQDKDGVISKSDLRATFDQLGRLVSDKELDEMVNEAPGPINFTQLLTLFAGRMSGGALHYIPLQPIIYLNNRLTKSKFT